MRRSVFWTTLSIAAILVVVAALFVYTVELRKPWFGASPVCLETWLNTATVLWSKNWYREGPLHLWFGYFWHPDSVEMPTLESRSMYVSYPPGAVLPIYLIGKALGTEPTISIVMAYALFNQLLVAVLLSTLIFVFLRDAGAARPDAVLLSLVPAIAAMLLPSAASQFQMAYFHIAVLAPYVLCVLLEFLRDRAADSRSLRAIALFQACVVFYGMLCDWLFAFVVFCIFVKRLMTREAFPKQCDGRLKFVVGIIRHAVALCAPVGFALFIFAMTLWRFGRFQELAARFTERSAVDSGKFLALPFDGYFWRQHMLRGYGPAGKYLIFASCIGLALLLFMAAYCRIRQKERSVSASRGLALVFLLLIPCLMHVYVFRQDSNHFFHFFTTAKFVVPIAAVPFVLLPVTLLLYLNVSLAALSPRNILLFIRRQPRLKNSSVSILTILLFGAACLYADSVRGSILKPFVPVPSKDPTAGSTFIGDNTGYIDVVFTPNSTLAIDDAPTQLAYSMKRVYIADTIDQIRNVVAPIPGEYIVNIAVTEGTARKLNEDMRRIAEGAYEIRKGKGIALYKIRKAEFLALCEQQREPGVKFQDTERFLPAKPKTN